MQHAALPGEIVGLTVVFAIQFFACPVGGSGNGTLASAAFDLLHMKMIQRHYVSSGGTAMLC